MLGARDTADVICGHGHGSHGRAFGSTFDVVVDGGAGLGALGALWAAVRPGGLYILEAPGAEVAEAAQAWLEQLVIHTTLAVADDSLPSVKQKEPG